MATHTDTFDPRTMLASGSRVVIVVSSGPYHSAPRAFSEVPDVVGANQGKALAALQDAGLSAQVFNDYNRTHKRGEVTGQLPVGGASVPIGAESVLLVSSGSGPSDVRTEMLPDVVGRSEAEAVSILQAASLSPQVVREHSNSVPAGAVIAQLPNRFSLAAQAEKRTNWVVWGATIAVILGLVLLAAFLLRPPDMVVVPDVVGLPEAEAIEAIEEAGLEAKVTEAEEADDSEPGTVVEQDPPAGTEVPEGSEEEIAVVPGVELVQVPDVVGEDQATATRMLDAAGFSAVVTRKESLTVAKGLVIQQTPTAGRDAAPESEVAIVISSGQPQDNVRVPDVEGLTRVDAQDALTDVGLKVVVAESASDTVADGVVITQLPAAGDSVAPGTSVGIVVSTGPAASGDQVDVPDVVGLPLAQAQQVISDAGLEATPVPSTDTGKPANEVVAQTPESGSEIEVGGTVVLFYSTGQ